MLTLQSPRLNENVSPGGSASGQLLSRRNGLRRGHGDRVPAASGAHVLKWKHLKFFSDLNGSIIKN